MGADFCCEVLTWDKKRKLDWAAGKKAIESLEYDEGGTVICNSGAEYCKDDLLSYLAEVKEAAENRSRDTAVMGILHLSMLVTGGVTWGDDPSETFTAVTALNDAGEILEAIGFNKDEIDYKSIIIKVLKNKELAPLLMGIDKNLDELVAKALKGKNNGRSK